MNQQFDSEREEFRKRHDQAREEKVNDLATRIKVFQNIFLSSCVLEIILALNYFEGN